MDTFKIFKGYFLIKSEKFRLLINSFISSSIVLDLILLFKNYLTLSPDSNFQISRISLLL